MTKDEIRQDKILNDIRASRSGCRRNDLINDCLLAGFYPPMSFKSLCTRFGYDIHDMRVKGGHDIIYDKIKDVYRFANNATESVLWRYGHLGRSIIGVDHAILYLTNTIKTWPRHYSSPIQKEQYRKMVESKQLLLQVQELSLQTKMPRTRVIPRRTISPVP